MIEEHTTIMQIFPKSWIFHLFLYFPAIDVTVSLFGF